MADYKFDDEFDLDMDKTYCEHTKAVVIWMGFPFIFYLVIFLETLLVFTPALDLSTYIVTVILEIIIVKYCVRKRITVFQLFGFLMRRREAVYYPTSRKKRYTRQALERL